MNVFSFLPNIDNGYPFPHICSVVYQSQDGLIGPSKNLSQSLNDSRVKTKQEIAIFFTHLLSYAKKIASGEKRPTLNYSKKSLQANGLDTYFWGWADNQGQQMTHTAFLIFSKVILAYDHFLLEDCFSSTLCF